MALTQYKALLEDHPGNLDAATVNALQKQGLLQQGPQANKDGFEKGKNAELSFRPGGGFGEGATAGDSVLANTTNQRANQYLAGMIGPKAAAAENPAAAGTATAGSRRSPSARPTRSRSRGTRRVCVSARR